MNWILHIGKGNKATLASFVKQHRRHNTKTCQHSFMFAKVDGSEEKDNAEKRVSFIFHDGFEKLLNEVLAMGKIIHSADKFVLDHGYDWTLEWDRGIGKQVSYIQDQ